MDALPELVCVCLCVCIPNRHVLEAGTLPSDCFTTVKPLLPLLVQTCLVYALGVEIYTFEAQTAHLRLHYTNYANDFVSAT